MDLLKFDDYCTWRNRECIKDSPKLLEQIRREWKELTLNVELIDVGVRGAYLFDTCYSKRQVIEMIPPQIKDLCWRAIGFNHWLLYQPSSEVANKINDYSVKWNPSCHDDEVKLGEVMGYFEPGCAGTCKTFVLEWWCKTPTQHYLLWSERVSTLPDGLQNKLKRLRWALQDEGVIALTITSNPGWN